MQKAKIGHETITSTLPSSKDKLVEEKKSCVEGKIEQVTESTIVESEQVVDNATVAAAVPKNKFERRISKPCLQIEVSFDEYEESKADNSQSACLTEAT